MVRSVVAGGGDGQTAGGGGADLLLGALVDRPGDGELLRKVDHGPGTLAARWRDLAAELDEVRAARPVRVAFHTREEAERIPDLVRTKTNLMVFLRPRVLRDAQATQQLSLDRYDQIRAGQQDAQPQSSVLVPINEAPVLPAITPKK